jgi:predicted Fe-Mo cluster-binding NifX family protein
MKLIITATAPDFEAAVDPRFGRGAYFIVVDTDTLQWQAHENHGVYAAGGAGSQAAQFLAQQGADAVISGDFGPNAYIALAAAEIKMYLLGPSKTAREAVANFTSGMLEQVHAPTGAGHHGGRGA